MKGRKIRVFRGDDNLYYFSVIGDNEEIISQSEGYTRRDDCLDTVEKYYPFWKLVDEGDTELVKGV